MSSMRKCAVPPRSSAARQVTSADRAWPRCKRPLGLGAKRRSGFLDMISSPSIGAPIASPRIDTEDGVAWHLDALVGRAPHLMPMRDKVGIVSPRVNPIGFAGLAKVVCGQQLSVQSAAAIWGRFEKLPGATDPGGYLALSEEEVRGIGFSRGKFVTVRGVAESVLAGELDFAHVDALSAEDAIAALTALKGIGPWTAEVYLLFCAGHPDVFPAGDL